MLCFSKGTAAERFSESIQWLLRAQFLREGRRDEERERKKEGKEETGRRLRTEGKKKRGNKEGRRNGGLRDGHLKEGVTEMKKEGRRKESMVGGEEGREEEREGR